MESLSEFYIISTPYLFYGTTKKKVLSKTYALLGVYSFSSPDFYTNVAWNSKLPKHGGDLAVISTIKWTNWSHMLFRHVHCYAP